MDSGLLGNLLRIGTVLGCGGRSIGEPYAAAGQDSSTEAGCRSGAFVSKGIYSRWKAFLSVKSVVTITAAMTVFSIVFMPLAMLFPLITLSHFNRGGYSASLIEAVFGIGMILGGALLSVLGSKWRDFSYMSLSLSTIGFACVLIGVVGSEAFLAFAILSFIMGAAAPLFNGPYMAMIQRSYEPEKLGRVLSLVTSIGCWFSDRTGTGGTSRRTFRGSNVVLWFGDCSGFDRNLSIPEVS